METLADLRTKIDNLDNKLIDLLVQRAQCIQEVIVIKKRENLPARIHDRVEEVVMNARRNAEEKGLDPEFAEHIWRAIIEWSIATEEKSLS